MNPETKQKLSEALKRKWASGTRRPNPPSTYEKASRTMRAGIKSGRIARRKFTKEQCSLGGKIGGASAAKYLREYAKAKVGVGNPPGPSAKGPGHWKSRYWKIKGPGGVVLEGWNLNHLIRENAHLFDKSDLNWRASRCRASKGIRMLFEAGEDGQTRVHSWKGWQAVFVRDAEQPPTSDRSET